MPDNDKQGRQSSGDMREVTGTCDVTGMVGKVSTLYAMGSGLLAKALHAELPGFFTLVRNQGSKDPTGEVNKENYSLDSLVDIMKS